MDSKVNETTHPSYRRLFNRYWPYLLVGLVAAVIVGARWFSFSDLYDNDQPKTVAYTLDMVAHHHWMLPVDMLGRPSTKPPMYNWLGSVLVWAGWHNEFALKLPSVLAAFVSVLVTWFAGLGLVRRPRLNGIYPHINPTDTHIRPDELAALACIGLVANYSFSKLSYTARPDMVLAAFLAVGWLAASRLLTGTRIDMESDARWSKQGLLSTLGVQAVLWICVAGSALTKGLPAALLVIYVLLGAKLIGGSWSAVRRTGILWGLPLAVGLTAIWAVGAYRSDPQHFTHVLLGDEITGRITRGGVLGIISQVWRMPALFVARFFPWSVLTLMAATAIVARRHPLSHFRGPLGPALLWVVIVIGFFSCSGGKRADYLLPALPAASLLAAAWMIYGGKRGPSLRPWKWGVVGLVVAVVIGVYQFTNTRAVRSQYGEHLIEFISQVEEVSLGEPIYFDRTGYTPIQSLLGYNEPDSLGRVLDKSYWLIKPVEESGAAVTSAPIYMGEEDPSVIFGLYRMDVQN